MPKAKYFAEIETAQAASAAMADAPLEPFDFMTLQSTSALARFASALVRRLIPLVYAIARRFFPIFPLAGLIHITRAEQVREVLLRPADFTVPFGPEMAELGQGATFMLGLDGADHDRLRAIMPRLILREDAARIAAMSHEFTTGLLANSAGRIDVIGDLFKRVPAEICLRYFGFATDNIDDFGDWAMAVSALLFGNPYGDPKVRALGLNGARRLLRVIDAAIVRTRRHVRAGHLGPGQGATLVERLVLLQQDPALGLTTPEIRAMLVGLVTGFIPTNALAASRMFEVLLARKDAMAMAKGAAQTAAASGDMEPLRRVVLEAGRLNPALAPGQWRYCPRDTTLTVGGRVRMIAAGSTLMVSTMSALRDPRAVDQPGRFWPDRPDRPDTAGDTAGLLFGIGPHACAGRQLATEQITALFAALLVQPDLRPAPGKAGKLVWVGPFPRRLELEFATPTAQQSMFLILAPVVSGAAQSEIDALLATLGFPADTPIRRALDATGIVHFTSLTTLQSERGLEIVWELSVDGEAAAAINAIAAEAGELLAPLFAHCAPEATANLADYLARHVVRLHGKPWGATGLNYNGTGEFPVSLIARQAAFAEFAERAIGDFLGTEAGRGSHPMRALDHLRRLVAQDSLLLRGGTDQQRALIAEARAAGFDAFTLKPGNARLKMTAFRSVTKLGGFVAFLKSRDGTLVWGPALAIVLACAAYFYAATPTSGNAGWDAIALVTRTLAASLVVMLAVPIAFFAAVRAAEKTDWVDDSRASLERIAALGAHEDMPGYAQNHIMALGELKPGLLRIVSHTFGLWFIRVLIEYNFRPGFVLNMGTIHYARWWRVPGTRKVAFYSNFDGSWESYLEDFITRAHLGQTAAWSNWAGFPRSKFMLYQGAEDGDRFKRWIRTRQQLVPFWYSRFPALTSDQIRAHAVIHAGVARAQTQDEAEEWLRCFGSMPRIENRIETDEVQALAFNGLKRLKFSASLAITLPPPGEALGEWLTWVRGEVLTSEARTGLELAALVAQGVLVPVADGGGALLGHALANSLTVTFGDRPIVSAPGTAPAPPTPDDDAAKAARRALFLALSAAGMAKFAHADGGVANLAELFPSAFRMGMARRGRSLGDLGAADAAHWRWSDAPGCAGAGTQDPAEAIMLIYAETRADLAFAVEVHSHLLANHGGRVLQQTDCAPARIDRGEDQHDFEHFGYRDGISQPVIRGTVRASQGVAARDLLEPGEFILGYANGQGYFPGSALLPPEADPGRTLPHLAPEDLSRYPDFDAAPQHRTMRDFGRNGSFLVVRELAQDVAGFEAFVARKADELRAAAPGSTQIAYRDLYKLIGQDPDAEWIKAKLMGRWPNGRPLVGNPLNQPTPAPNDRAFAAARAAEQENDFSYGADDPQGLACPFGAHIRRTNPRDSKQPGDPKEQIITNRHRLLRRGRTYTRAAGAEKGLLFVSLCADLERQFEFVQQIWANAPGFHGLAHEPDPIVGAVTPEALGSGPAAREFSIPTAAGPVRLSGMQSFVAVKAGGYFFLPSRSALNYLTEVSLAAGEGVP